MHTQSHKLWSGRLALAALAVGATGCFNAIVGDGDTCIVGDAGYAVGEKYKDDCNTCTCQADGTSECTLIACGAVDASVPPGQVDAALPADCEYQGKPVAPGQMVTTGNDCEACRCEHGKLSSCEYYACPEDGGAAACFYNGSAYSPGWFLGGPSCKCQCFADGKVSCDPGCDQPGDAGVPNNSGPTCTYGGKEFSGVIFIGDQCSTCTCLAGGKLSCVMSPCQPDGGVGECHVGDEVYPVGDSFTTGLGPACEVCHCIAHEKPYCEVLDCNDAGAPAVDASVPTKPVVCVYQGKTYQMGEGFLHSDNCNKCVCTAEGVIQCSNESCMTPSGCLLGDTRFDVGTELVCTDGCNTCTCGSKTDTSHWSMTKIACPALPAIAPCPTNAASSAFPAQLVYLADPALAVVDSRCVSGQTLDYGLCWESANLASGAADLYVYATGTQRACNAAAEERVFNLEPLRQALIAAQPGMPRIKASLRGSNRTVPYEILVP
jgi:hypothetical protein